MRNYIENWTNDWRAPIEQRPLSRIFFTIFIITILPFELIAADNCGPLDFNRFAQVDRVPAPNRIQFRSPITGRLRDIDLPALEAELADLIKRSTDLQNTFRSQGFNDPTERKDLIADLVIIQDRYEDIIEVLSAAKSAFSARAPKHSNAQSFQQQNRLSTVIPVGERRIGINVFPDPEPASTSVTPAAISSEFLARRNNATIEKTIESFLERYIQQRDDTKILLSLVRSFPENPRVWSAVNELDNTGFIKLFIQSLDEVKALKHWHDGGVDRLNFLSRVFSSRSPIVDKGPANEGWIDIYDPVSGLGLRVNRAGEFEKIVALDQARMQPLPRRAVPRVERELDRAGSVWTSEDKIIQTSEGKIFRTRFVEGEWKVINELEDGAHVYLVTTKGRVISSARTPNSAASESDNILATHRALEAELKKSDPNARIAAAGEFHVMNGRIPQLNNRAGSYHGGVLQLEIAKNQLARYGLPIEEGTIRTDYGSIPTDGSTFRPLGHEEALDEAETVVRVAKSVELRQARAKIKVFYARVSALVPDSKKPGHTDYAELTNLPKDLDPAQRQDYFGELLTNDEFSEIRNLFEHMFASLDKDTIDYTTVMYSAPESYGPFNVTDLNDLFAKGPAFFKSVQRLREKYGLERNLTDDQIDEIFQFNN